MRIYYTYVRVYVSVALHTCNNGVCTSRICELRVNNDVRRANGRAEVLGLQPQEKPNSADNSVVDD